MSDRCDDPECARLLAEHAAREAALVEAARDYIADHASACCYADPTTCGARRLGPIIANRSASAASILERLERAQCELGYAQVDADEGEEIAVELFALCCSVVDGAPDAAEARTKLADHVEHVRKCRKGGCAVEVGDRPTVRAERDALARKLEAAESEIGHLRDVEADFCAMVREVGEALGQGDESLVESAQRVARKLDSEVSALRSRLAEAEGALSRIDCAPACDDARDALMAARRKLREVTAERDGLRGLLRDVWFAFVENAHVIGALQNAHNHGTRVPLAQSQRCDAIRPRVALALASPSQPPGALEAQLREVTAERDRLREAMGRYGRVFRLDDPSLPPPGGEPQGERTCNRSYSACTLPAGHPGYCAIDLASEPSVSAPSRGEAAAGAPSGRVDGTGTDPACESSSLPRDRQDAKALTSLSRRAVLMVYGVHANWCSAFPLGARYRASDSGLCNCGFAHEVDRFVAPAEQVVNPQDQRASKPGERKGLEDGEMLLDVARCPAMVRRADDRFDDYPCENPLPCSLHSGGER